VRGPACWHCGAPQGCSHQSWCSEGQRAPLADRQRQGKGQAPAAAATNQERPLRTGPSVGVLAQELRQCASQLRHRVERGDAGWDGEARLDAQRALNTLRSLLESRV
jgi:hypothetical protein